MPLGDVQAYVSQRGRELARSLDKDPQNVVPLSKRLNASLIPLALRPTAP